MFLKLCILQLTLVALLVSRSDGFSKSYQEYLRRMKRQSGSRSGPSSLVPPRIPYASLSTGAIPKRVRNRLRAGSVQSSAAESGAVPSSSNPSRVAGSSTGYLGQNRNAYGGATGQSTSYGGAYNPSSGQAYRPPQFVQQTSGSDSQNAVPAGASTYPFLGGVNTGNRGYDNPYSSQRPPNPMPQFGGGAGGRAGGYQQQQAYQPMGGYIPPYTGGGGFGYGGGYSMGGNPFFNRGGMYGGAPQMSYANPYAMPQSQNYRFGSGYPSQRYPEAGTSIGSPYRDPNSPYSSYIHPSHRSGSSNRHSTGSSYGGGGGSYGGGSESQYTPDYYGSSSSQSGYPQSGNSYQPESVGGAGYGGSSPRFGQTGTDSNYEAGGSYGGSTSGRSRAGTAGASDPVYGAQDSVAGTYGGYTGGRSRVGAPDASDSSHGRQDSGTGRYVSGGSAGGSAGDSAGGYGAAGSSGYGGGAGRSDSYASNSARNDPYGSVRTGSYGTGNSPLGSNPYSQTSGSRYGESTGSQYNNEGAPYGGSNEEDNSQEYDPYSQAYQSPGDSVSSHSSYQGQQTGRFVNPSLADSDSPPSFPSGFSQSYQNGGQYATPQSPRQGASRTSGRFRNPSDAQPQTGTQTSNRHTQSYQSGQFFNPQDRNSQARLPGNDAQRTTDGSQGVTNHESAISDTQSDSPIIAAVDSRTPREDNTWGENYQNQDGTFLIPRREGLRKEEKPSRKMHPSMKKCQRLGDGLPDLYIDHKKMKKSVFLERVNLTALDCAASENCLAKSAYKKNSIPVRKLLKFATIAHNNGTADFLPDIHHSEWIFHSCHNHWHSMKEFAHFHLLTLNGTIVEEGHKVSFCLEDSGCRNPCKKSYECTRETQGISPGCYDSYLASRDCQWIDVTDVLPGVYRLRVTVNPLVKGVRAVPELFYTNNAVECTVAISMNRAQATKCWMK